MEKKKILFLGIFFLIIFILIFFNLSSFNNIDKNINKNVEKIRSDNLTLVMIIVSFLANSKTLIFFSLIILFFLSYKKRYNDFLFYSFVMFAGWIAGFSVKILSHRLRPENILTSESSFSFPSGHSLMSIILFFLLVYLFIK